MTTGNLIRLAFALAAIMALQLFMTGIILHRVQAEHDKTRACVASETNCY